MSAGSKISRLNVAMNVHSYSFCNFMSTFTNIKLRSCARIHVIEEGEHL